MNGKVRSSRTRAMAGLLGLLACGAVAEADVTIVNTVNFSALDGGPLDDDGAVNGQFFVNGNLTIRSLGTVILDQSFAQFVVTGNLRMLNSGAIRTASVPTMDPGPFLVIFCLDMTMTDNALIRSHGLLMGGFIQIFSNSLDMRRSAKMEAHSTVANGLEAPSWCSPTPSSA